MKIRKLSGKFFCQSIAVLLAAMLCLVASDLDVGASTTNEPPLNDNFARSIEVSGVQFQLTTDLGKATGELFETPFFYNQTAWWSWVAPSDGIYEWSADANNTNAFAVGVFRQDFFGQLTAVSKTYLRPTADGQALNPDQKGTFQAVKDQRYYIQLDLAFTISPYWVTWYPDGYMPEFKPVSVVFSKSNSAAPSNDDFANRIELTGTNSVFTAELSAATAEPNEPAISTNVLHRTLWWTWEAPYYGTARIQKHGANESPAIGIYNRGMLQSLQLIATSATVFGNRLFTDPRAHAFVEWDTVPGERYEIQADRFANYDERISTEFEMVFTPAPSNDTAQGAIILEGTNMTMIVSNTASTLRTGELVMPAQSGSNSVWFQWTAPSQGIVQIGSQEPVTYDDPDFVPDTTTGAVIIVINPPFYDPLVDLYPPVPFVPVFGLFYNDGSKPGQPPAPTTLLTYGTNNLISEVQGGRDYWIALDGDKGSSGQTNLNLLFIARPSNDDYANRISLPAEAVRVKGRTFASTHEAADPAFFATNNMLARSVWWEWHAPSAGRWTLFPTKGMFQNKFVVYRGTIPANANQTAATENEPVVFSCEAGEVFEIGVFGLNLYGGSFEFTLTPVTAPVPRLIGLSDSWDGRFRQLTLSMPDNSGLNYVVDRSEDLTRWTPVLTNANAWSHSLYLYLSPDQTNEFFRTRLVP